MRVFHWCVFPLAIIGLFCSVLALPARADGLFTITDLGPASPTANVAGGNQSSSSSAYPYLSGQNLVPSNGDYLTALTAAQQASFQSGSFDLYAHPATTNVGAVYYPSQFGGYDAVNTYTSVDQVSGFQMTTSNNHGVTVGTARESITSGIFNRLVEFTPSPHTVTQQNFFLGQPQQFQSPGYVSVVLTKSDQTYGQFWGTPTGINDQNHIAFTQYNWVLGASGGWVAVLAPHLFMSNVDTALGSLGGANGAAYALNNSDEVVGWSQIASGAAHAFLYVNGTMEDLNLVIPPLSGITLTSAVGINTAGEIVAYGTDASGRSHEYLLTPSVAAVPEPSTLAAFAFIIAALAARRALGRRSSSK